MGRRRVDLQTAAELLGISSDAVRKRAKRGTMPYETGADGKLYVWVDSGRTGADEGVQDLGDHDLHRDDLVEELRDRVRALEEANRENRRIIAALTSRIPQLEAPRDEPHAPETAAEPRSGTDTSADAGEAQEATERRSWWRRLLGVE